MVYFNKDLLPVDEINPMWKSLNTAERMYLRENAKYEEFKRGSIIYREGAAPTHMYCLISGKVKIFRDFVGGRSQLVRIIGPGESLAYRAYFAGENFMTSAAAVDNSEAYSLPLTVVGQILKSNNSLAVEFIKLLSRDLGVMDIRVVSLTQKHVRGRLAETLVMLMDKYGTEEDGKTLWGGMPREDLASFSNMTISNAIRTLSNFASEGIIELDGRRIRVLDEEKLRRISQLG